MASSAAVQLPLAGLAPMFLMNPETAFTTDSGLGHDVDALSR
jgi:hypothetical protein